MTVTEIVDAIWAYYSRTVDGLAPVAPDGSYKDDVRYAVWTYPTRTVTGGVSLTAKGIYTGAPTLGKPAISQTHALTARGIYTGAPTLGKPALTQSYVFIALGLETTPILGKPAISQFHVLTARGIYTTPTLGRPALLGYAAFGQSLIAGAWTVNNECKVCVNGAWQNCTLIQVVKNHTWYDVIA